MSSSAPPHPPGRQGQPKDPYAVKKQFNYHILVSSVCRFLIRLFHLVLVYMALMLRWSDSLSKHNIGRKAASHYSSNVCSSPLYPTNNLQAPLVYAPILPLIRIGLRGRLPQRQIDIIFGAGVLTALGHAG